jgi:hypothetical protein
LRGVRESVLLWVPVFFVFLGTHAFAILYALGTKASALPAVAADTVREVQTVSVEIGVLGHLGLLLRASAWVPAG